MVDVTLHPTMRRAWADEAFLFSLRVAVKDKRATPHKLAAAVRAALRGLPADVVASEVERAISAAQRAAIAHRSTVVRLARSQPAGVRDEVWEASRREVSTYAAAAAAGVPGFTPTVARRRALKPARLVGANGVEVAALAATFDLNYAAFAAGVSAYSHEIHA